MVAPWPCGCTSTGLISISEISLTHCAASIDICAINCDSAGMSVLAAPLKPLSKGAALSSASMAEASAALTELSATLGFDLYALPEDEPDKQAQIRPLTRTELVNLRAFVADESERP